MAKLTKDDILKLARLSRLKLTDEEVENFAKEISAILGYVEMLDDVDTRGVEPTYQVTGLTNVFREDEENARLTSEDELLSNLPDRQGRYIKVKRML